MFVDAILVGKDEVKRFKHIIQKRRRETRGRWIMGDNNAQNKIIMRCRNMWFAPWSLGQNKKFMMRSRVSGKDQY